jgi:hypothetical protein
MISNEFRDSWKILKHILFGTADSFKLCQKVFSRVLFKYFLIKYGRGLQLLSKEGGGLRPPPSFGFIFDQTIFHNYSGEYF